MCFYFGHIMPDLNFDATPNSTQVTAPLWERDLAIALDACFQVEHPMDQQSRKTLLTDR